MSSFTSYQAGSDAPRETVDRTPQLSEGTISALAGLTVRDRHELLSSMDAQAQKHHADIQEKIRMLPHLEEAVRAGEASAANHLRNRKQRMTIVDGVGKHEVLTPNYDQVGRSHLGMHATNPAKVNISVNGIEMGPEQALEYLADGTISKAEYNEGLRQSMEAHGNRGWKPRI